MAKESIFARKKREMGTNWVNEIHPDKLFNMCENIFNDIAYGNLTSNEDKWYLVSEPVLDTLINFCEYRLANVKYAYICEDFMRNFYMNTYGADKLAEQNALFVQNNATPLAKNQFTPQAESFFKRYESWWSEGGNSINRCAFENIQNCCYFYDTARSFLMGYRTTHDPTLMVNLYSLCADYKKYINPNRFM